MKKFFFMVPLFAALVVYGQEDNTIILGRYDTLYSRVLKEKRRIWVSVPEASEDDVFGNQRLPVVYVLDGDLRVASMVRQMEGGGGNLSFPKMIVVGIMNTDRTRDLTPTHSNGAPLQDSMSVRSSGGGGNFTRFIETELIPYIDSAYPTAPYRMLMGHSFGGLFVINTLVHKPRLFNAYVATEPSMWWDKGRLLRETGEAMRKDSFDNISLFLGIAHTQPAGMDTAAARRDSTVATVHIRSILALEDELRGAKNRLAVGYKYYPDYDHGSSSLPSGYDALRWSFGFYNLNFPFRTFFQPLSQDDTVLTAHYRWLSGRMGYTVLPPAGFVSTLAHILAGSKQWDRALRLLMMNRDNHPGSYKVYEELGDVYAKKGDKELAVAQYRKALAIKGSN
jgi:predicted alpha/beta superfamily hydrolase